MYLLIIIVIVVVLIVRSKKNSTPSYPSSNTPPATKPAASTTQVHSYTNQALSADMTLEEARRLADAGNADAMMMLVDYYSKDTNNEKSSDLLSEYLERAAEAGHPVAIIKIADASYNSANIMITMISNCGRDDSWEVSIEQSHKWVLKLIELLQSDGGSYESKQLANKRHLDIVVWLSAVYSISNNWYGIIRITKSVSAPAAKALYGYALYELAETGSQIEQAFTYLANAMHSSFLCDYNTSRLLEAVKLDICSRLSHTYRVYRKDCDEAYNVLSKTLPYIKDPKYQENLRDQMALYLKTASGGYQYIG